MSRLLRHLLAGFFALAALIPSTRAAASPAVASDDRATTGTTVELPAPGQARVLDEKGVQSLLAGHGKELLVVNMWATWCGPCVEEIPDFVKVSNEFEGQGVLFAGLSCDFLDQWEALVPKFLQKKDVSYPNFVLAVDPNEFIPAMSSEWSGNLPATFFYDAKGRKLGENLEPMEYDELKAAVEKYLKQARAT